MAYRLQIEGEGRFPILTAVPLDPPEQRSGHRGPFTDRELIEDLTALCVARCHVAGCPSPAGGSRNTWHLSTQLPARDVPIVTAALTAYLQERDEQPLRSFLKQPPDLRARPQPGESWAVAGSVFRAG